MKNQDILLIIFTILILFTFVYIIKKYNQVSHLKEVEIVPPQFVYNILENTDENVLLVNVLSNKMKYKITLKGKNDKRSLSLQEFEKLLMDNNNNIPKDVKKVIIYCASWSCNGAKNYYKELIKRNINVDKVVDYIGSIHEWAS